MRIGHLLSHRWLARLFAVYLGAMSTVGAAQQYDAERDEATNSQEVETVIVTARRTDEAGFDLATSWAILDQANIERVAAQHSNQLFNRVSGAWVSRGNGQESLVSLRSPVLTGAGSCGAFMTAEDGISMRSPGFCNVNQLFDANLLQAGRVEVLKGPGAVVFGSNALHGIINVVTRSVDTTPNQIRVEAGSRDYYRVSASGAVSSGIALSAQTRQYGVAGGWMVRLKAVNWIKRRRVIFEAMKPMRTIRLERKTPTLKPIETPGLAEVILVSRATGATQPSSLSALFGAVTA